MAKVVDGEGRVVYGLTRAVNYSRSDLRLFFTYCLYRSHTFSFPQILSPSNSNGSLTEDDSLLTPSMNLFRFFMCLCGSSNGNRAMARSRANAASSAPISRYAWTKSE